MKHFFLLLLSIPVFTLHFHASAAVRYVNANNPSPAVPFTSWSTAATNIQDAVNHATSGETILVTNGIYQYDAASFNGSNRVYVSSGLQVQSVDGPAVTVIKGYQVPGITNGASAVRCVYLSEFSTLSGFTLTNGATQIGGNGGGVVAETLCVVSNCLITRNAASANGGGSDTFNGSLVANCVISGNVAGSSGGGAYGNILNNCIITNNYAVHGGGVVSSTANNCLLVGNGSANT